MDVNNTFADVESPSPAKPAGIQVNYKRVADRVIRYWYLVLLFLLLSLVAAYLVNRYSTRIYPIKASILIRENEENVGAKFLYDNELLSPYRNFYNEIYIMKSYPLIQEVLVDLGFNVSVYREGDILTTEYYDPDFPAKFHLLQGSASIYGTEFYFQIKDESTFSLQYVVKDQAGGKVFDNLQFNDSLQINGYRLLVERKGDVSKLINKTLIVRFHNPLTLAVQYSNRLGAKWAQQGAAVVDLEISMPVAQKGLDFLNRFIERYQYYDVEKKNKTATMALQFLDQQLVVISDSLKLYEDQVENFKDRNIITDLQGETARLFDRLQELEAQRFQYQLVENYYDYIVRLLDKDEHINVFTPGSVGITDEVIASLITELIQLQSETELYKSKQTTGVERYMDNPRLIGKEQRIRFVKEEIKKSIANSRSTQQINLKFVADQIKLVDAQLGRLPKTERELVGIQRNYSLKENLYMFLLQKRTEAGLSKASTTSDILIVNPPMAGGAVTPKVTQNYGIAAAAGVSLPLLLFVLLELLNTRIQSREDIESYTSVSIIGGVGHNRSGDALVVFNKPKSAMAESFRALRSNLNYFTGTKEKQVFLVTSSIPGEGKSFTTINIAIVLAMSGKRTLILGADLRKPKLFQELELQNSVGLSQFLSGMASVDQIIQRTKIENLSLITGGPLAPNPSELLMRPEMTSLMEDLKSQYDCIVIDTPPLAFVTDAFVLSAFADHTIFVVRQDFTPKEALRQLDDFYTTGRLSKVSILFNDLRKSGLGYGYGAYGDGYNYYGYSYGYGKAKNSDYYSD